MYSISRYIFYLVGIDTVRNRLKILLIFYLSNFLCICFPTTHRPLCSTAFRICNRNYNNNNNTLSLCKLTLHVTPCERMRGDCSVSRQSHTASTLAVSSSSNAKWTVWNSCCNIRCHTVAPSQQSQQLPKQHSPLLPNQQSP